MAYLSTAELSAMRDHAEATLPDTCTIAYRTIVPDGSGGGSESWTSRGTAIACRLAVPGTGRRSLITQATIAEGQTWMLSVPYDQTVALDDRVTVGADTFRVQQVNFDESEMLLKRVNLARMG